MEATLERWPLEIPTAAAERLRLLYLLVDWREEPDLPPGSTLRLGDRHSGIVQGPNMIAKLSAPAQPRRHGDAVLSLPVEVPNATRVRPVAFTKQYTEVANLTPLRGATGLEKQSQVYRGTLGPSANISFASTAGDTADVIVKIYQTSRLEVSSWQILGMDALDEVDLATNGLQDFEQEIWAYNKLSPLHGSVVPYIYGFFRVILPHGEPCIALVEEHIPNISRRAFVKLFRDNLADTLRTVADNLSAAVLALHSCGVYQYDLAGRNVLLPIDNPTSPVMIDFADVSIVEAMDPCSAIGSILNTLVDIGFNEEAVKEWAKRKILEDKSWVVGFDVPDNDWNYLNLMIFRDT